MAVQKPTPKKAPAKKVPAKKVASKNDIDALSRADFYKAHNRADAGKGMARLDAAKRSGLKPKKDFYDTTAGKAVIASSPVLSAVVGISAFERAVRKKIKGKKASGDPTPRYGK
jgi:hypothetical protein